MFYIFISLIVCFLIFNLKQIITNTNKQFNCVCVYSAQLDSASENFNFVSPIDKDEDKDEGNFI